MDHEFRQLLNDELHVRSATPVHAPAHITYVAHTLQGDDADPLLAVQRLALDFGTDAPADSALHHHIKLPNGSLRYERHGEFFRISIINEGGRRHGEAEAGLPAHWLDILPGKRLCAVHTTVLRSPVESATTRLLKSHFSGDDIAASRLAEGEATAYLDFRIGPDGFTRILLLVRNLSPVRLARYLRRIHEIETYRMMALLALPIARQLQPKITRLEIDLGQNVELMLSSGNAGDDARSLEKLGSIARETEAMANTSYFRFAAARAYATLVSKRVAELGEEHIDHHQRIGVFLDRRFSPAMATCQAVNDRIINLARRCERASNLLRTRVDIALEAQNQDLLASMNERSRQQLRLQETVEGLSVAAISYYVISIIFKFKEKLALHMGEDADRYTDIAIIILTLLAVWFGVKRLKKRLA